MHDQHAAMVYIYIPGTMLFNAAYECAVAPDAHVPAQKCSQSGGQTLPCLLTSYNGEVRV